MNAVAPRRLGNSVTGGVEGREESLPFQVRLTDGSQDLQRVADIRASAYGRHLPHVGAALREPEDEDSKPDVLVLLAERKFDGQPIGTLRIEPNFGRPLRVENEVALPSGYAGRRLVETSRLGSDGSAGNVVMASLVKAAFEICLVTGIDYTIAVARRSMAEVFRSMCFDVLDGPVRMSFAPDKPFWICSGNVLTWEEQLRAQGHRYHEFMVRTFHPDIAVDYDHVFEAFRSAAS